MEQNYNDRRFMIFSTSELNQIDFTQVGESSIDTVRKSVDKTKTFVKWDGNIPECVVNLTTKEGPYVYSEMIVILDTLEWSEEIPEI